MIFYIKGDATVPNGKQVHIIPHVVNSDGGWGAGFVLALSKRWSKPETEYRTWATNWKKPDNQSLPFVLGKTQFVQVETNIWVANMLAQQGYVTKDKGVALKYDALEQCLMTVAKKAKELCASITAPKFGSGLAGGNWEQIAVLIEREWKDIPVTICEL